MRVTSTLPGGALLLDSEPCSATSTDSTQNGTRKPKGLLAAIRAFGLLLAIWCASLAGKAALRLCASFASRWPDTVGPIIKLTLLRLFPLRCRVIFGTSVTHLAQSISRVHGHTLLGFDITVSPSEIVTTWQLSKPPSSALSGYPAGSVQLPLDEKGQPSITFVARL